jgi:hypothetical protein
MSDTVVSPASVATERGARYVRLNSTTDALVITVEAADTDIDIHEDVVGRHLERFGERDRLRVHWVRSDAK